MGVVEVASKTTLSDLSSVLQRSETFFSSLLSGFQELGLFFVTHLLLIRGTIVGGKTFLMNTNETFCRLFTCNQDKPWVCLTDLYFQTSNDILRLGKVVQLGNCLYCYL